ncbi:preprotein translocase subunit SecY [Sphingosinicella microcystinivorans]|uniref:Protein translocase subunit SecY n=1 Tax=Sphingosinicella microcystinivorans TaxID=335406 RepID=A0AAD1D4X0_SPHMI|nr:preprotein translocase subunit SecY [Sphingosinicella microcystinivorans]RKS90745.1 protein translocase subunit secY/sec61 alpha [Sphingosinicella microcystinivorans]BBE33660.1 protein translocase subunit SecY [Sphingosinicella microcystinivorans]
MASAAEQLAANLNWGSFSKATDLKKRLWFTLGALIVFRLCSFVPLPGIDPVQLNLLFDQTRGGVLDFVNMFSGGALERMSIVALNIMPYITASIIVQLMTSLSPSMAQLKKEGESGRKKINQYTRYGTVALTLFQGYGIAVGLEGWGAGQGASAVLDPGWFFRITTMITLLGGTMFLMWLGEQITARGIGNGISLIIMAGIVATLPGALAGLFEQGRTGAMSGIVILAIILAVILVIAFICFMERAQRRILVQYPKRQVGNRMSQGESSHLPLKLNTAGVIPPIFASSLLLMPLTVAQFAGQNSQNEWMIAVTTALQHGSPLYMSLYAFGIIFFCFFYTAVVFNPEETADNLKRQGGFIPGIRPGEKTTQYLDYVLTRITVVGAAYLTLICLIPEFLISSFALPFYFGGTSLLIVVNVTMDTVAQIQSHLLAHQYEGLIKKAKLRGNRR